MPKHKRFSDQLRELIRESGQTPYKISQETGIERATLSRFLRDQAGLSTPNLDTLAKYLGWTVIKR
jgi:transcriptional regulator with XRE-family HTH domain